MLFLFWLFLEGIPLSVRGAIITGINIFTMMLSRSRMKYVYFSSIPFTTDTTINADEAAFQYFNGITAELGYDQDKLLLSSEQIGDLLLTSKFKAYVREQALGLHFCRKSDPESKGRIENVVKYVKGNFLYGRVYCDIETLQQQVLGWLTRTGNGVAHSTVSLPIFLSSWDESFE
ncbi:DDE-type integrase/transposase/recombinase [Chitinophaga sancti]|uniref:DDE-type integrase/transposase/recombinase n=2 Tax=Chitinophaga sancti TaxID=1004 RepID=A0A1K1T0K3_9BACT|nr:DDE-type integrase/transposase/recombinase [Chitinophaga sancti]WQD59580.1 DDE-type integrase/transposase/recombinase [Chitinophaga sancti]WQG88286.1 DDE-type integrase/transposase/recombinase [Chitinophaga sancti]SFW90106.1 Integrase core domain-containing protein [Chitinophaga sancti]